MILYFVLCVHGLFVLILIFSPSSFLRKKEQKPLVVNTVRPKSLAMPKKIVAQSQPVAKKAAAPQPVAVAKKTPPPTPAKKAPAPVAVKKEVAKPAPQAKKQPAIADKKIGQTKKAPPQERAKISDNLLKELEESIAKMDKKSDKTPIRAKAKPIPRIALQIDAVTNEETFSEVGSSSYTDLIVNHLHQHLSLPDYGEVKIQLSLRQDGTVAKVVVLRAQSEKNRLYLESNLLRLKFPCFEGPFATKKESTFTLTFCNEL
jgi:outer membrane biosynthesis protein TonB